MTSERGMVRVLEVILLGPVPLLLAWLQDWYVDVNAPSCASGTGTESNPFCDISSAVAAAVDGDTIHVAAGTYFGNVVLDKDLNLVGTEGQALTILDGAGNGSVVRVLDSAVTLAGLTLTNGTGTPGPFGAYGGGLLVTDQIRYDFLPRVTLTGCTVMGNSAKYGGGVSFSGNDTGSALTLRGCTVKENSVSDPNGIASGGGILTWGGLLSDPVELTLENSTVSGNSATGYYANGGGVLGVYSLVTITNSTVNGNSATGRYPTFPFGYGGGIIAIGSLTMTNSIVSENSDALWCFPLELTLTNSTVTGNTSGGLMYVTGGTIENSILFDNGRYGSLYAYSLCYASCLTLNHTLLDRGWPGPGVGNIAGDPLFVDPLNGDYRLQPGSPCIDAGDNSAVPPGARTDLQGSPRFLEDLSTPNTGLGTGPVVDMGAFEFGKRFRIGARRTPETQ